jgi:hypothetical protein
MLALYSDSNGSPSQLLASTASTAITGGVQEIPVVNPIAVTPGTYWIMGVYGGPAGICSDKDTVNTTVKYTTLTFGNPLPQLVSNLMTYMSGQTLYYAVGYE